MKLFKKQEIDSEETDSTALEPALCSLKPFEPNGLSLEEQGYTKVPGDAIAHANAALQYIPGQAAASMSGGLYKAVFDHGLGVLQRSAQHPGLYLGNVVSPETNNVIRDVAVWQEVSAAPQLALSIFTAVSIVTGQYFMAQTNKKLGAIADGILSIKQFLEAEDFNELKTTQEFFRHVQSNIMSILENDTMRQTAANTVTSRKLRCQTIANKYRDIISGLRLNGKKKEQVLSAIDELSKYLSVYHAATELYCISLYLETVLSQTTAPEYIHNLKNEIQNARACYGEDLRIWNTTFIEHIESAVAFRIDRLLLNQPDTHFWDRPINAAKEAVLVRRDKQPKDAKKQLYEAIHSHSDVTVFESVSAGLEMIDRVYNKPVEAVIVGHELFIKPVTNMEESA